MDTRFPPPPAPVRVPLYPQYGHLPPLRRSSTAHHVRTELARELRVSPDDIVLANSASNALFVWLQSLPDTQQPRKIALPSFNCLSLIQAVISAGWTPVFLDLTTNMTVDMAAAKYAVKTGCQLVVWPNYFGARQRDEAILRYLKRHKVGVVFDDAQAFPFGTAGAYSDVEQYATAVLMSFGNSKPLAGLGGGAIYVSKAHDAFRTLHDQHNDQLEHVARWPYIKRAVMQRLLWRFPRLAQVWHLPKRWTKLDELLEATAGDHHETAYQPMTDLQAAILYRNLRRWRLCQSQHQRRYQALLDTLHTIPDIHETYLKDVVGVPSIVALNVAPGKRYEIFEKLSQYGIQTTWYYFPLHCLSEYSYYETQPMRNTLAIAERIVILPLQWGHNARHHKWLLAALRALL